MGLLEAVGGFMNPPKAPSPPGILSWTDDAGELVLVDIDIIADYSEGLKSEITDHPIEDGSVISDHIILKPPTLNLEIKQSEYPSKVGGFGDLNGVELQDVELPVYATRFSPRGGLLILEGLEGAIGAIGDLLFGGGGEPTLKYSAYKVKQSSQRILDLQTKMFELWQAKRLITVSFLGRVHRDYAIESVGFNRTGDDQLGHLTLELRYIRTVKTGVADLPDPASLREEINKGQQPPVTAKEAEDEVQRSLLKQGSDLFGFSVPGSGL